MMVFVVDVCFSAILNVSVPIVHDENNAHS